MRSIAHDALRRFCIRLGGEAVRIGQALGYELEHIGKLDPERLAQAVRGRTRRRWTEIEAMHGRRQQLRRAQRRCSGRRWARTC